MKLNVCRAMKLSLLMLFCSWYVAAQNISATITGTVVDSSGAAVPKATVTVLATDRHQVIRTITTNGTGEYAAPLLPVGNYAVTAKARGFKSATREGIVLNVNDNITVKFTLEVGQISEKVTVEEAPVAVELQSAEQSNVIVGTQIRDLALSTRNFAQLVGLVPGVSGSNSDQLYIGHSAPAGSSTAVSFAMNGNRSTANYWQVDGADNVDHGSSSSLLNYPSLDALSEFRVLRSSYSAEFGRSSGGQINVITKSGTSEFHGDAYEFVRNNAFAANNFLNNANAVNVGPNGQAQTPPLRYNDFGYTVGGPIYIPGHYNREKNKTFFFFSQEFRRVTTYTTPTATVPTAAQKNGIFSKPICLAVSAGACTQTATQVPASMISPLAGAYINDIFSKIPNGAPGTNLVYPLFRNVFNQRQELYKIDHVFGPKLSIFGRFLIDKVPTIEPSGLFNQSNLPGVATTSTNAPGHSFVLHATSSFTPTFLNEAGFNYSYGAVISDPIGLDAAGNSPDIHANLPYPVTLDRVPSLSFGGGGTGLTGFGPYRDYNYNYTAYDNVTKIAGRHNIRFGYTENWYEKIENSAGNNVGTFSFTGAVRPAGTNVLTQSWADFLLGRAATYTQLSIDATPHIRENQAEFYFQDDIHLAKNFTLNAGLRYSLFRQPYDGRGHLSNFDQYVYDPSQAAEINPATGNIVPNTGNPLNGILVNGKGNPYGSKVSPENYGDLAPRFGFAWDPFGKGRTSIRAGYGIYYDSVLVGIWEQLVYHNPPLVTNLSVSNTSLDNPGSGTASLQPTVLQGTPVPYRTPYVQQWSFDIQHQLTKDLLLDVGYFGSKGTHLTGLLDMNEPYPGAAVAAGLVPNGTVFTSSNSPLLNSVRPYPGYSSINQVESWFNSNYNSLQVSLEKRFSSGSLIKLAYTYSKNLTDSASDRSDAPQNTYNFHEGEYGLAAYDRRQVLIINYVYDLPFFKKQQGFAGHVFGGWEISGITTFETGLPSTVTSALGTDPAGLGLASTLSLALPRPDWACNPNVNAPETRYAWFNTSCFVPVPAGANRPGDAGRATIEGPGLQKWDLSLFKNIRIRESMNLQIRGEAYNVFNHTNPNTFGTALGSSTYGQVTAYHDPRILQLAAKFYF